MAITTEIAPNVYRISIFAERGNLQFNHFLVKDDEPLLFHTGLRGVHTEIREAVAKLISISELRHTESKPKTLAIMHGSSFTGDCACTQRS
jgi:hypothetical protein